jgi:hypothetical protein
MQTQLFRRGPHWVALNDVKLRMSHGWAHKAPRDHSKLREALMALAGSQPMHEPLPHRSAAATGATRTDLDGNKVDAVSERDEQGAHSILILRRKRELEKQAAALCEAAMKRRGAA